MLCEARLRGFRNKVQAQSKSPRYCEMKGAGVRKADEATFKRKRFRSNIYYPSLPKSRVLIIN